MQIKLQNYQKKKMEKKNEQMAKPCCSWRSTKEKQQMGNKRNKKKLKPAHQLVCPCLFSGTHAQGTGRHAASSSSAQRHCSTLHTALPHSASISPTSPFESALARR